MRYFCFLLTTILLLNACSLSKNWKGTYNSEGIKADFDELNGKQVFTVIVPDNNTYLKYHFNINSGKIETIIKSPKGVILNTELSAMVTDSIHVVNQKGAELKIYLKGRQASGGFDIQFTDSLD